MLGLVGTSDPAWTAAALADLDAVLVDHAHCEMKAASNALSLIARHPESPHIIRALTHLAREEMEHFERVLGILERRGLALGPPPVDEYAADLRRATAFLRPRLKSSLVDRLLVAALIEARSCERFKLLSAALEAPLRDFYGELLASEARHHRVFVELAAEAAQNVLEKGGFEVRLATLSRYEAEVVGRLARRGARPAIHG